MRGYSSGLLWIYDGNDGSRSAAGAYAWEKVLILPVMY